MTTTRRTLLKVGAGASLLPLIDLHARPIGSQQSIDSTEHFSISERLSRHAASIQGDRIPADGVKAAKISLMDAVGVSIAAAALEPICAPFLNIAAEAPSGQCTVFGRKEKVDAGTAAWANGALAHALDYEDVHDASGMHPNAAVVPVALALAESNRALSGREVLEAIAIGSDIACRLGLARPGNLNKYGWYFPPIASAFGATATAGRLLALSQQQMCDAFSLTLCQTSCSSELVNSPNTHVRAIRDAFPARTAIESVRLAKAGVRGFELPFEGDHGFAQMYARGDYHFDRLVADLGSRFLGAEVSFKAWPACRGSHPYIQAALDHRERLRPRLAEVRRITALVRPLDEILCVPTESKQTPSTTIDAKFSIPFTTAYALVHGEITHASFEPAALMETSVLSLSSKFDHRVVPSVETGANVLEMQFNDGAVEQLALGPLLGSPARPMSEIDIVNKFRDNLRAAGYDDSEMGERILDLESAASAGALME